jgi:hypothetical protein
MMEKLRGIRKQLREKGEFVDPVMRHEDVSNCVLGGMDDWMERYQREESGEKSHPSILSFGLTLCSVLPNP